MHKQCIFACERLVQAGLPQATLFCYQPEIFLGTWNDLFAWCQKNCSIIIGYFSCPLSYHVSAVSVYCCWYPFWTVLYSWIYLCVCFICLHFFSEEITSLTFHFKDSSSVCGADMCSCFQVCSTLSCMVHSLHLQCLFSDRHDFTPFSIERSVPQCVALVLVFHAGLGFFTSPLKAVRSKITGEHVYMYKHHVSLVLLLLEAGRRETRCM